VRGTQNASFVRSEPGGNRCRSFLHHWRPRAGTQKNHGKAGAGRHPGHEQAIALSCRTAPSGRDIFRNGCRIPGLPGPYPAIPLWI